MMIETAVLDMDGLMIDWQMVMAQFEILPRLSVPITQQDTIYRTGMRIDAFVQKCRARTPWYSVNCDAVCSRIMNRETELVRERNPAIPGFNDAIEVCRQQGWNLALASHSTMLVMDTNIAVLRLDGVVAVKSSGGKSPPGKPHPDVNPNASDALGFAPPYCVTPASHWSTDLPTAGSDTWSFAND